jgi:hypothetical protein
MVGMTVFIGVEEGTGGVIRFEFGWQRKKVGG